VVLKVRLNISPDCYVDSEGGLRICRGKAMINSIEHSFSKPCGDQVSQFPFGRLVVFGARPVSSFRGHS
jgi:hypothetical protein